MNPSAGRRSTIRPASHRFAPSAGDRSFDPRDPVHAAILGQGRGWSSSTLRAPSRRTNSNHSTGQQSVRTFRVTFAAVVGRQRSKS